MDTKALIHKEEYIIASPKDTPYLSEDEIAKVIVNSLGGIRNFHKYELDQFPILFKNIWKGTRKDLTFHYSIKGGKLVDKDPLEFEGIKYFASFNHEEGEDVISKVDYVSFFTVPEENISEHRIYQIGPKYSSKEKTKLDSLLRKSEKEGDITSIINILRKILKLSPNEYKRWTRLGELLVKAEQYDKAIEACRRAVEIASLNPDGWVCLGMAYYGLGDIEKAQKFFEKTLSDYDSGSFHWYFRAVSHLAKIHFNSGKYEKALEYCNQYLDYDYSENKRNSKEIFKLKKLIKQKLGLQEESPQGKSEAQVIDENYFSIAQRLYDDNYEYIELLNRSNLHNLKKDAKGKVIENKRLVFCRDTIISFFEKKFTIAYIDSNIDKKDFKFFVDHTYPKLVLNLEVFYGGEAIINLIASLISNTKELAYIYIPLPFQEILSFASEWAYIHQDKKIVFYSFWEDEFFDKIYSNMNKLGNIQVRLLSHPYGFYVALRDEEELILTPFSHELENTIGIRSKDGEFVNFYKTMLIPILNGDSKPINFKEKKVIDNINKFLDGLLKK